MLKFGVICISLMLESRVLFLSLHKSLHFVPASLNLRTEVVIPTTRAICDSTPDKELIKSLLVKISGSELCRDCWEQRFILPPLFCYKFFRKIRKCNFLSLQIKADAVFILTKVKISDIVPCFCESLILASWSGLYFSKLASILRKKQIKFNLGNF